MSSEKSDSVVDSGVLVGSDGCDCDVVVGISDSS